MKIRKINSLLGLNIIIVILNIVVFSPGLIGINIDFIDDFKTAIGITVIIMSIIIFIIGNYKILINSKEEVDIFKLEDDEDYINALRENSYKKVFSKGIDILLNQIERISKKQERIDDILLQKFNENEISYKNFKNIISEVVNVFYINLKSVINKINIFDEEEYRKVKKENINNKISQEKIEMFQKYITFVKESVENNEEILLKLDKVLLELSKFNSLEDGELENMNAVKEVDELINKIKFYK